MRVACVMNEVSALDGAAVRERIRRSVHLDGPLTDLVVGQEYAVEALEQRDGGIWFYLHTVPINDYPYPYPAEMFEVRDNILPSGWSVRLTSERGSVFWHRMTFSTWTNDDRFYEKLVAGDHEAVLSYGRRVLSD
jgi:hypothetical protein